MTEQEIEALCLKVERLATRSAELGDKWASEVMESALTAIRQLQQPWRGIESAPRDGSDILILAHGMAIQAFYAPGQWSEDTPISPAEYSGPLWVGFDDAVQFEIEETPHGDFHGPVTAWMPLPTPPETGQ